MRCGDNDGDWWDGVEGTVGGLERPPPDSRPQQITAAHNKTKKLENEGAFSWGLWVYVNVQARWDDVFAVADCLVAWSGKLG